MNDDEMSVNRLQIQRSWDPWPAKLGFEASAKVVARDRSCGLFPQGRGEPMSERSAHVQTFRKQGELTTRSLSTSNSVR